MRQLVQSNWTRIFRRRFAVFSVNGALNIMASGRKLLMHISTGNTLTFRISSAQISWFHIRIVALGHRRILRHLQTTQINPVGIYKILTSWLVDNTHSVDKISIDVNRHHLITP